ncbi:MAG: cysteine dioxygenase family protein [Micropruina glycogenica]
MTITAPTPALNRSRTLIPSSPCCNAWSAAAIGGCRLFGSTPTSATGCASTCLNDVDLWLLTWTTAQGTELHDHGDSEAAFAVISGVLSETRVRDDELVVLERRPGAVVSVLPGELHDVRNELPEPAISIHAYSPRLATMTFYSFGDGRATPVRTVHGDVPEVD